MLERDMSQGKRPRMVSLVPSLYHILRQKEEAGTHSESGIPLFRLTVTPLAIFGNGPKVRQGNKVVAHEDNSNSAEHSVNTLKEHLQEGKWMGRRVAST
jgi:hypothetical protein